MGGWDTGDIPDQRGRSAVVTGANRGLGFVVARELAAAGAAVVLACRNVDRGLQAAEAIRRRVRSASVEVAALDMADLTSIEKFAGDLVTRQGRLEILVNNAAAIYLPRWMPTVDGFEAQFGTNHLGHFALTGRLLPALMTGDRPRVVTVTSLEHRRGRLRFDDLMGSHRYGRYRAYRQSKLANTSFGLELDRRLRAAGAPVKSVLAHPGFAATPADVRPSRRPDRLLAVAANRLLAQTVDSGALPLLYAATAPDLPGGAFVGPRGLGELRGGPRLVSASAAATDGRDAMRLWAVSEDLTGVDYRLPV